MLTGIFSACDGVGILQVDFEISLFSRLFARRTHLQVKCSPQWPSPITFEKQQGALASYIAC